MIDTDKYEGHTEGEWVFKHINSNWYQCDKIGEIHMEDIAIKEASANAQLIADAPLLLEEVKRLREENQRLGQYHHCLSWCYDKERFGWEIDEEQWEIIGRLLGAFTDHNDNKWGDEEE